MALDARFVGVVPIYLADYAGGSTFPPSARLGMNWFVGTDEDDGIYGDGLPPATGMGSDDLIQGGRGEDFLVGDFHTLNGVLVGGNDILNGGRDNDRLYGDANYLLENSHGGNDILYGDEGLDIIYGDAQWMFDNAIGGSDDVRGGEGNDLLLAGDAQGMYGNTVGGDDRVDGGAGDDRVFGDADTGLDNARGGNDVIIGGTGNDVLVGDFESYGNGFAGVGGWDRFIFGVGSGTDVIKDFEVGKDIIQILPSFGFHDFADLAHRISDNADGDAVIQLRTTWNSVLDVITLRGVSSSELSASDFLFSDEVITGSSGNNQINPTTSVLQYRTTGIHDVIFGGAGNDVIDGGGGPDMMDGGAGNDTFFVDVFSSDGIASNDDQVIEASGGGVDTVNALVSYKLPANVENLKLVGAGSINGTGNDLANTIIGNDAANWLEGGIGNDALYGAAGNDTLVGGTGDDKLDGGADLDTLIGGAGADILLGKTGQDTLIGGLGKDMLTGGSEADTFVFNTGDTPLGSVSQDRITDFSAKDGDRIDLDFINGSLATSAFSATSIATNGFTDALAAAQATPGSGHVTFVAGTTDGWIFYDSDGDGVYDQSVELVGTNTISALDAACFV